MGLQINGNRVLGFVGDCAHSTSECPSREQPGSQPSALESVDRVSLPFVPVIMPVRNECKFLPGCLDSLLANDYPQDRLEILVADGMSTDDSREMLGEDVPVRPGQSSRLVCTELGNPDMPLIGYEVGDRVAMAEPETGCPCGRTLPVLKFVEGRIDDMVITPDGRRIGRLDPVFKGDFPIVEAQVIQDARDHLLVQIVPAPGCTGFTESALVGALVERMGRMQIEVRKASQIPRGPNGKFKALLRLPFEPQLECPLHDHCSISRSNGGSCPPVGDTLPHEIKCG